MAKRLFQMPFDVLGIVLDVANLLSQILDLQLVLDEFAPNGGL